MWALWDAMKARAKRSNPAADPAPASGGLRHWLRRPLRAAGWAAFDHLASMVAVVAADGRIRYVNVALEDVLGQAQRALQGQVLPELLAEPQALAQALQGVRQNAYSALRFDAGLLRPEGDPLPVHVIVTQSDDPDLSVVELLAFEQQLRHDRAERQQGLGAANKELIRNLAHEIKNPLGGIRGAAQLLEMDIERPELREYTQVIIHEADRLQALVDRLLAPHRQPHLAAELNIHEVCERVGALLLAEFPRGLRLVRDYDASIPEFRGDRQQLIQALLNIVHNAAQALALRIAAGDAAITLRTRVQRQVTIGGQRHRLVLQLLVIDNGPGVPADIHERVFYPLVSGREGGTGLGLTLAQSFVQQHGGQIEMDSRPGHTEFRILLPLPVSAGP